METSVNKVELMGFVGKDAEVTTLKTNAKVARFSIATSERYQNKTGEWISDTTWHNIVLWNKAAELATEQIKKGVRLSLVGKIVNRTWEDKEGKKHYITEIQAFSFEIMPAIKKEEAATV